MKVLGSVLVFTLGSLLALGTAASAQTLDGEVARLLSGNCAQLGVQGGNDMIPPPELGSNLNSICLDNNAQPASSTSGGGGAASQGNDTLLRRRVETRIEQEREGLASDIQQVKDLFDVDGLGIWASGEFTYRERDQTTFEDGYESDVWGGSVGADYRFNDRFFAGAAFNYHNIDADFDGGGGFETDSYGGAIYASLTPTPETFIDVSASYAAKEYEVDRAVSFTERNANMPSIITLQVVGIADSETDGDEFSLNAQTGYDFVFGGVTVGPRAGVNFSHTHIDGFTETGRTTSTIGSTGGVGSPTGLELVFEDRTRQSLQSVLGVSGSIAVSTPFGVLLPQLDAEWVHEFQDDQERQKVRFVEDLRVGPTVFQFENEKPDRDFFNVAAGTSLVLPGGFQAFVLFRTLLGHDDFESYGGSVGVRYELGGP